MTLHVSLPKELEALVQQEVQTGMYGSASEVVREALRAFFGNIPGRKLRDLAEIREEVQETLRRYDAGEEPTTSGEEVFRMLKEKYDLDD